jgi:hypothetical protein
VRNGVVILFSKKGLGRNSVTNFLRNRVAPEISKLSPIFTGVLQETIISPILFNIFSADQTTTPNTSVAEYADDKPIVSTHNGHILATNHLQNHLNLLSTLYTK